MLLPSIPPHTSAPYYAPKQFYKFVPLALVYNIVANVIAKVCGIQPKPIIPAFPPNQQRKQQRQQKTPPVAIVTGSNTGIGFETSRRLVIEGYHVILACRDPTKGLEAVEKINQSVFSSSAAAATSSSSSSSSNSSEKAAAVAGHASFLQPLDLSSFSSVREFCSKFQETHSKLDLLVNNAGINFTKKRKSNNNDDNNTKAENELDFCFQTNFLSHYLLTTLLMPQLLKRRAMEGEQNEEEEQEEVGRVVNLSSVTHHFCPADDSNAPETTTETKETRTRSSECHDEKWWKETALYGRSSNVYKESKLAAILFSMELNKRHGSQGLLAIAANPGSVNSDIWRKYPRALVKIFSCVYLNTQQGATTSVAAALEKFSKQDRIGTNNNGCVYVQPYWLPSRSKVPFPPMEMLGPYVGHALAEPRLPDDGANGMASAAALWNASQELVTRK